MQQKTSLGLEEGRAIVEKVLEAAQKTEPPKAPMTVAVVDRAGDLIYFARMDGASPQSARMAINKAYTAIQWQRDTREVQNMMKEERDIAWFGDPGRQAPVPGGILIRSSDGTIAGAVGTSELASDAVTYSKMAIKIKYDNTSGVVNGSTISHGLPSTPIYVVVTPVHDPDIASGDAVIVANVYDIGPSSFKVALYVAVDGGTLAEIDGSTYPSQNVYWIAICSV